MVGCPMQPGNGLISTANYPSQVNKQFFKFDINGHSKTYGFQIMQSKLHIALEDTRYTPCTAMKI